jgi:tetratricopeptide (TPR) repeat protein
VLLVAAAPALADPGATDRARAADAAGRAHYELREYQEAIRDYRSAYEALPDPLFLFDIAQAYRQLADCGNARAFYRNYLREQPLADNRAKVEQFIAEMDACVATPPASRDVVIVMPPEPPPPRRRAARRAGLIVGAGGLALLGLGTYFAFAAADKAHQLELACAGGCMGGAVAALDRAGHDADRDAIVTYSIGGAAVATGVALVMWSALARGPEPVLAPTRGGATVSLRTRF